MVTIKVPVGTNGWMNEGWVQINGKIYTFPVGVETQVPEPVAHQINEIVQDSINNQPPVPKPPYGSVATDKTLTVDGAAADAKAVGEKVAELTQEIDELKENGGAGDASELVKSVSTINHVLDIKEGSATTDSLIDFDTAAKKFEKTNGTEATRFVYDEANGYVNANQAMSSGNVFFAGQKLPVAEGEIYTVGAFIQFGDAATSYKINIGIEGQSVSRNLNAGSTGDPYIPGTWKLIKATFTVNAETASKENARISIIAVNGEALPLYIRDLIVVAGDTLPEIGETTATDSVRLVNIEKRLDSIEREIPASDYEWENPVKQFSVLFNNTDNVESFLFFTDPHLVHYSGWEQQLPEYTDFIAKVYNKTPTTFCVCGGDWLGNSDTMEEACYKMGLIDSRMRSLIPDYCPIVGNHDTNYQGKLDGTSANGTGTLSVSTYRNLWFRREGAAYYRYQGATSAMYVLDSGVEASAMTDYRWQQIDWLAESLKAEQMPNAFIALHIIYASGDSTTIVPLADNAMTVAEAYNASTTITLNGMTYDFTGCTGKVRFVIGGHTHTDQTGTHRNIPFVITTQTRQNGVPTFDLVLADYDSGTVHLVRVGDGDNRTVVMA